MQSSGLDLLLQIGAAGVYGYTLLRHHHIHHLTGGDHGVDMFDNGGNTATGQRRHHYRQAGALGGVGMAADSAADHAIRASQHVDIEICVDLQCGEDHEVQLIHRSADHMAGVVRRADLVVEMIVFQ